MKKRYLIGIDIGTSGTKSVLFDTAGTVIAEASAEYPLVQVQNGWAEQDPADWWHAVCKTLRVVTARAKNGEIAGLGLSGQMHSVVLLDKSNEVLRPSIIWCDQRTAVECEEIEQLVGHDRLIAITANPALTGFTASKIRWVQKHEPQIYEKCAHILLAKDYIRFCLTGEYATEVSDASGMQLLDVPRRRWSAEVCEALGVDMALLAKVYESPEMTGRVTAAAAALTGLPCGLPVAGGAGDNAAAAIGCGVDRAGKAFTTVGTSGVVFAPIDSPIIDPRGRVHTFCAAVPGTWHLMGVTQSAGLSLNWFRRQFAAELSYRELDEAAATVPIGAERLLYLPYLMGERTPILDADARGVFFGLTALHTRAHLVRAVMEGITYSLYSSVEILHALGASLSDMTLCGGGAKSPFWREMFCDVYGLPIKTMQAGESAALGAAILGGCASGIYTSVSDGCAAATHAGLTRQPDDERHKAYLSYYEVYSALYPALRQIYGQLKEL